MENKQVNHENHRPSRRSKSIPQVENGDFYAYLNRNGSDSFNLSGSWSFSSASRSVNNDIEGSEKSTVIPHLKTDKSNSRGNDRHLSSFGGDFNIPRRPRGFLKRRNSSSIVKDPVNCLASTSVGQSPAGNCESSAQVQFLSGKRESRYDDKENGSSQCNSTVASKETDFSLLSNFKKAKRSRRPRPNTISQKIGQTSGETQSFGACTGDDDEESLEENAARMLSSRFNPRHTEDSVENSTYSSISQSKASSLSSSSSSSSSLNLIKSTKKSCVTKERHFYEVCSWAFDPYWVLKRRISVFWPLDQSWYVGLVKDYNPTTMMHHVKYDERNEEWINLQGKRFKLLLLPNEFMSKFCQSKVEFEVQEKDHDGTGKMMDVLESEPIISWLARSTKRFKASNMIRWSHATDDPSVIKPNGSTDDMDAKFVRGMIKTNCYDVMKFDCVYSRRQSKRRMQKDGIFHPEPSDIIFKQMNKKLGFMWFYPLIQLFEHTWILKNFLLSHHSKLLPRWPTISMEIVFLDNTQGLKFLSLNGDLLLAVKVLSLFITIFYQIDCGGEVIIPELPLTSVGLKLSYIQGERRPLFFYVYNFLGTDDSQWLYIERQLKQFSVKIKVLPLSETSYAQLKMFHAERNRSFNRKGNQKMLWEGHIRHQEVIGQAKNCPLSLSNAHAPGPSSFLFLHFNFLSRKEASLKNLAIDESVKRMSQIHHGKRQHHRRKRPNNTRYTGGEFESGLQKNIDLLTCKANILVTIGDRGWREHNAQVTIDADDPKDWKIIVKVSGAYRYFYKPHLPLQQGATNRFTHAMLWKGDKDWTLEFPDRKEWSIFKEMYQECCGFNLRAASLRRIPIPGVSLVEDYDVSTNEVMPFVQSSNYYRQKGTEVDVALNRSRVIYDMDSEDEEWISKSENSVGISEVMERMMDILEKEAFLQRRVEFKLSELESIMDEVMPLELVKMMYEYWLQKRRRKGIPLIREFQPPLWEQYQQQLKDWESAKSKIPHSPNTVDKSKPPMFAFCLRPRGLELPNKYAKQRSHKKLPFFPGRRATRPPFSREKSVKGFHMARQKLERYPGQTEELLARDAVNAAQHLSNFARFKREKAHWMMHRADMAIHRAISILMTVEAMELGEEDETETESSDLVGVRRAFSGVVPLDDCVSSSFRSSSSSSSSDQEYGSYAGASPLI